MSSKPQCNGICVMGWEVLDEAPVGSVAYVHPDCELHNPIASDRFTDPSYDIFPSDVDGEDFEIRRPSRKPINPTHIKPGIAGVDYAKVDT